MRGYGFPTLRDFPQSSYKTLAYVQGEVNRLAEQLAAVEPTPLADAVPESSCSTPRERRSSSS